DQPQNQERMADSRQQLEQTRENVRRASESLEQGELSQASAAGARAGEQLNNLRDEFRRSTAGQFNEAMNQMRDDARRLDQNQQQLSQRLNAMTNPQQGQQRSLRDPQSRDQITQELAQQKQQLDNLLDQMRKTS